MKSFINKLVTRWQSSVRYKGATAISSLLAIISIFIYIYFPLKLREQALLDLSEKAKTMSAMIAYSLAPALYFDDSESIKEILESAQQSEDLGYIVVFNKDGEVAERFFHSGADSLSVINFLDDGEEFGNDNSFFRVHSPIHLNERLVGNIAIGLSLNPINEAVHQSRQTIALVSVTVFIFGMLAVFLISRIVIRPLQKMVTTVEEIAAGDMTKRSKVRSNDEIGHLASVFNVMVDRLESAQSEMEEMNRDLERIVDARTAELQKEIEERIQAEERIQHSLDEKEVLLKEIHHRVKNNLQVISSLLSLQVRGVGDKKVVSMFEESRFRIRSMALVHEKLYGSNDLSRIDFADYIRSLANNLAQSFRNPKRSVQLDIDCDDLPLSINLAVPCGLIINELITNALKHAFPRSWKGKASIGICVQRSKNDEVEITVKDNGIGLPEGLVVQKAETLGLKLVTILSEGQLNGKLSVHSHHGSHFQITFKLV